MFTSVGATSSEKVTPPAPPSLFIMLPFMARPPFIAGPAVAPSSFFISDIAGCGSSFGAAEPGARAERASASSPAIMSA